MVEAKHPSGDAVVPPMLEAEVIDVVSQVQPLLLLFDAAVHLAEDPDRPPLAPEPLLPAYQCAVIGDTGVDATCVIDGVAYPEGHDVLLQMGFE